MKVFTVVAARPQFIKAAMVSKALSKIDIEEILVHTGQHYDTSMSDVFFSELETSMPNYNLGVGSGSHAYQTGQTMIGLENILIEEKPDLVIVYGDVNATLAAALTAAKLCIPYAHVEAGLRSFDNSMPEEINRIVADRLASILFCPTSVSVKNLLVEGIIDNVHLVGDVMYDASLFYRDLALKKSNILANMEVEEEKYCLLTIHRNFNTDNSDRLRSILKGIINSQERIVFPVHPRTLKMLKRFSITEIESRNLRLVEPVSYLDMIRLEIGSKCIITDSGGVQKEAYFYEKPCLVLRDSTEWTELVENGWAKLVDANSDNIAASINKLTYGKKRIELYGDGRAAEKIVDICAKYMA